MRIRRATVALCLLIALALVALLALCTGAASLSPGDALRGLFAGPPAEGAEAAAAQGIVWNIRLPRLLLALLVGAGLAVAGVVMQAYFQNPMADPYIVGVSAGGALGATAGFVLWSGSTILGLTTRSLFAFVGATSVTVLVYCLARRGGRVHTVMLLLTGLAISALASALCSLLVMVAKASDMQLVVFWLMGSVADRGWTAVWVLAGPVLLSLLATYLFTRELNVILMGEEVAHHLGVDVERTKLILLALSAILAACCVAISGMIGFVGLIVPHFMRLLTGPDHRALLPAAALGGGVLLAAADVVARSAAAPIEIPIGIVTSILGCPFFLFLLHRARVVKA
ncbi:MAG: iron chelate uptake ABC transporter family permease subunit [Armatimonadetes bacterium]|nr:iron chelate uptake ABC transporter family permease subunit [Armatimonadota bacterium]